MAPSASEGETEDRLGSEAAPYFRGDKRNNFPTKTKKSSGNATIDGNMDKMIASMEKSFKKLASEELVYAVGDFQTVLNWISIDSDPKLSVNKCQK